MSWEFRKLNEIVLVKSGKRLPKGHNFVLDPTNHPYIRARDIKNGKINIEEPVYINNNTFNIISRYTVRESDVVITIVGANVGDIAFIDSKHDGANLTENAAKLIPKDRNTLSPKFLKYSLFGDVQKSKFQQIAMAAAQPKLGLYKIKDFEISIPKIETQKRIADILIAYDDLIENSLKRIKLLEQAAQNIYKEWFINLHFPGHENTPINKETGLPEGWEKVLAKEYFDFKRGIEVGSKNYVKEESENTIPFIRVGSIGSRDTDIFTDISLVKDKILKLSDVVVSMDGSIGIIGYGLVGAYSTGLRKVAAKSDKYGDGFIFCLLKSEYIQNTIRAYAKGSTILHASSSIEHMSFNNAPSEITYQFNSIIEPIYNQMLNLNMLNQKLKAARDILLPRLMNRTIEV